MNASFSPTLIDRSAGAATSSRSPGADASCEEVADAAGDLGLDDVRRTDEAGDESGGRTLVDVFGEADLLDLALRHHRDAVAHHERLFLVVRDVDERDADLALDAHELELHLLAQLQVERAERLVEQQHRGLVHERASERDALLLTARQLRRSPVVVARQLHQIEVALDPVLDVALGDLLAPEAERDVVGHRQVREQRVRLEHGVDVPLERRHADDVLPGQHHPALVGLLEAGDHSQRGRLAAS